MEKKRKPVILTLISLTMLYLSPLSIFKADYHASTSGPHAVSSGNSYTVKYINSNVGGHDYRLGLGSFTGRLNNKVGQYNIKSFTHINLGLYSKIWVSAELTGRRVSLPTTKVSFTIYGLASHAQKRRYAELILQRLADDEIRRTAGISGEGFWSKCCRRYLFRIWITLI